MKCRFCNADLTVSSALGGANAWFDCKHCEVNTLAHVSNQKIISHMYHRDWHGQNYVIYADHTVQRLRVGSPTLQRSHLLVDCPYPIDSINPTNIMQKLQTLLIFL